MGLDLQPEDLKYIQLFWFSSIDRSHRRPQNSQKNLTVHLHCECEHREIEAQKQSLENPTTLRNPWEGMEVSQQILLSEVFQIYLDYI